jgi:hypothetical protein
MSQITDEMLEDFGFEDENELIEWSQTLCFDCRWHYSTEQDETPKNFRGWPAMLVTDGDCGVCHVRISEDGDDAFEVEPINCYFFSIRYEYLEEFRLAVDEADREFNECLLEDAK